MKVLVIGGNGFIGSRLVARLRAAGDVVRVADVGSPRDDFDWTGIEYHQVSLGDRGAVTVALSGMEAVFHCASSTVPSTSNLDPVRDVQENLVGAVNLLEAMRACEVRRIVYLSSGGTVYGHPTVVPVPEYHELQPISSYGVIKVAIEKYLLMYQALYGIEPVILRPSNPYGPGQMPTGLQGLIGSLLGKVVAGDALPIWGDGEVVRDYLYIDDLIDMLFVAVRHTATGIFNVGSGEGHSVNDVVRIIGEVTNHAPRIKRLESRNFDVRRVVLDISRAREVFGWAPRTDLPDGVGKAWTWISGRNSGTKLSE